jgi:type I restriction enzyme S subunit
MKLRMRHLAEVNPHTPEFDRLSSESAITFMPLDAVWADSRLDLSRSRAKSEVSVGYTRFRDGDVIVPKVTPTFQAARSSVVANLVNGVGAGSTELHVLRARLGADARFLQYVARSQPFLTEGVSAFQGVAGLQRVTDEFIRDFPVAAFSLEEQRRIADFLDTETRRISRIVELQREVSGRLLQRQSAWLNRVMVESEMVVSTATATPLGHLVDHQRPVMYGIVLPGPNVDDGVPIIKGGDVAAERLTLDALNRTTREIEAAYARSRLVGGDILIAIRGSVGETAVVPDELTGANLTQDAARIAARHDVNKVWLRWILHAPAVAQQVQSRVTGATIKGINIWDLKRVLIPAPPRHVQDRIASIAVEGVEHARHLITKIDRQVNVLAERRSALITAAVTGQIDVTTARGVEVS